MTAAKNVPKPVPSTTPRDASRVQAIADQKANHGVVPGRHVRVMQKAAAANFGKSGGKKLSAPGTTKSKLGQFVAKPSAVKKA